MSKFRDTSSVVMYLEQVPALWGNLVIKPCRGWCPCFCVTVWGISLCTEGLCQELSPKPGCRELFLQSVKAILQVL